MKPRLSVLMPLFALLVSTMPALAQVEPGMEIRTILVSGSSEQSLPADRVQISVQVKSVRDDLADAQSTSKTVFGAIVEKLGEFGIKSEKIELRDHELGKEYQDNRDGERIQKGFYSTRDFKIELDDASLLEAVYTELAQSADVQVNSTSFTRKDEIEVRKELRKSALAAAREKAIAMAEVYGQKVGKPLKISEGNGFPYNPYSNSTRNTFSADGGDSTRGRVSLTAQVEVVFELLD